MANMELRTTYTESKFSQTAKNAITTFRYYQADGEELEEAKKLFGTEISDLVDARLDYEKIFIHNSSFTYIKIHDHEFELGPDQAKVIRHLYNLHLKVNGNEHGVHQDEIYKEVFGKKLVPKSWSIQGSLFKSRPEKIEYDFLLIRVTDANWRLNL
jgi:hypothetical protein